MHVPTMIDLQYIVYNEAAMSVYVPLYTVTLNSVFSFVFTELKSCIWLIQLQQEGGDTCADGLIFNSTIIHSVRLQKEAGEECFFDAFETCDFKLSCENLFYLHCMYSTYNEH